MWTHPVTIGRQPPFAAWQQCYLPNLRWFSPPLAATSFLPEPWRDVKGKGRGGVGIGTDLPALGGTPSFLERFVDGLQAVQSSCGQRSTFLPDGVRTYDAEGVTCRQRILTMGDASKRSHPGALHDSSSFAKSILHKSVLSSSCLTTHAHNSDSVFCP